MKKIRNKGISLIVLVITIIVIVILATAVIIGLSKNNPMDSAKKAKFMANFTNVEEAVGIYSMSKLSADNSDYELPLADKVTLTEKETIKKDVPTLATKIAELNPGKTIDNIDLYHIDPTLIGAENLYSQKNKGYLIDVATRQIYDYSGEYFEDARWHTLDSGVKDSDLPDNVDDVIDVWDGWITLTLYYPSNSTERKWRLGESGEIRGIDYNDWKDYTGAITVRLSDVENIWISYVVDNKTVIVPPLGRVLVDIRADGSLSPTVTSVKVNITYDENATVKQYKVGDGSWQDYTGEFTVTEPAVIQARAERPDNVYDQDGNIIQQRKAVGTDAYYVGYYDSSTGGPGGGDGNPGGGTGGGPGGSTGSGGGDLCGDLVPASPDITWTPTTKTDSVQVSINAPAEADRIYIKIGDGSYQRYTTPITVTSNTWIRAYYITYDGEASCTKSKRVDNIQGKTIDGKVLPYVSISSTPTTKYANKVTVTLNYSDADSIEYSTNGIVYTAYTGAFEVTENCTIYARAINVNGVATDSDDITIIGDKPPQKPSQLAVNISVNPEPAVTNVAVDKVKVSIEYDSKATEKYYKIGSNGTLTPYTGEFELTSNSTIYAYAINATSSGSDTKIIDNIVDGISEPVITGNPRNTIQSTKTKISIEYDKNATIKQYKINSNGQLRDYTGTFEVTQNCTVYAYSKNVKGQSSSSIYQITNIVPAPPVLVIDYGKYYLLKLNFPEQSTTREYKWKVDGTWKAYDSQGILLIKPEYKNEILNADGNIVVKIKDENGQEKTYTGDYYILDVAPSEIFENLFMRWDRVTPVAPQIIPSTSEPTRSLTVQIQYEDYLVKKEYKVVNPDGSIKQDWTNYTGPINIDVNNTVIYARGQDDAEVWSTQAIKKITNIDETSPEIHLTADLEKIAQNVQIKVSVTDDVKVQKVKWAAGIQGESYFATAGTEVNNNSVVKITENGYYTFYAEDGVGNKQVYTLNIENIDLTPPAIDIQVSPETTVGTSVQITINYGDSTTKQYKIGESNTTWTNYTAPITLTSSTVLANNWKNADGTVTIYAKGKDAVGNEKNETKKILNLDLDAPKAPVINSNAGYPLLTSYGVKYDSTTTITYDTRTDIDNYYSIDNGATWQKYIGSFDYASGIIIAKSVKKNTGLEISVSKSIAMPSDAIGQNAYDGNDSTYDNVVKNPDVKYINVDSSLELQNIRIKCNAGYEGNVTFNFVNESDNVISSVSTGYQASIDKVYLVPVGTKRIRVYNSSLYSSAGQLFEIQPSNEPVISATNGYMLLNTDPTKAIRSPYQLINISYFPTSVQRLYRIGTTGEWKNYEDKAIWLNQGETIYTKGIDQYGNDTRIISSYTANVTDAVGPSAYDGNDTTYDNIVNNPNIEYINVDSSLEGNNIRIKCNAGYSGNIIFNFINANNAVISSVSTGYQKNIDTIFSVPIGTRKIGIYNDNRYYNGGQLFEIQPSNEPIMSATNGYMLLHADPTKAIKSPYQLVNISYFPTSVQKLYRIGTTGEWKNYEGKPIIVNQGETIYAKGIDKYGNETRITSSYTANVVDAVGPSAYDGNDTTYDIIANNPNIEYIDVDSSLEGKNIRIKCNAGYSGNIIFNFINGNNAVISSVSTGYQKNIDTIFSVPIGTRRIGIYNDNRYYNNGWLYEIQPST